MKFILAEKQEMTQKFTEDGSAVPVTRVVAGPCVVTQVKKNDSDGYAAVQLGFGNKKNLSKPVKGHLKNLGNFKYLKEFRIKSQTIDDFVAGIAITAKTFQPGDKIKVAGLSKGRGFQGVVKRHGFHGSPATHGHKDQLRMPGSIGSGGVQHVFKGTRMAGRMGGSQVTVSNLSVIEVDPIKNEIFIKGAVPGARGNLLLISADGDIVLEQLVENQIKTDQATDLVSSEQIKEVTGDSDQADTDPIEQSANQGEEEVSSEEQSDKEVLAEDKPNS